MSLNSITQDKKELLENIYISKRLVEQFGSIYSDINRLYNSKAKVIDFISIYPATIGAVPFVLVLDLVVGIFSTFLANLIFVIMAMNFVTAIIVLITKNYLIRLVQQQNIKKNGHEIEALKCEGQKVIFELQKHSIIPQKYWTMHALSSFEGYLLNIQADSLKECINIYEQQLQHMERINELKNIQYGLNSVSASVESLNRDVREVHRTIKLGQIFKR
ncbi:MAG: hypothetical protein N3B21_09585 [Clostridia bacterium]|nr:hypothetical protein [Clostridia bacterium]